MVYQINVNVYSNLVNLCDVALKATGMAQKQLVDNVLGSFELDEEGKSLVKKIGRASCREGV